MKLTLSIIFAIFLIGCGDKKEFKTEYYENGRLKKSEGYYIHNKAVDTLKTYYPYGNIRSIEVYNLKNQLDGQCRYYFEDGKISEVISFVNGEKNGEYQTFLRNGALSKRAFFYEDLPMGDAFYYDSVTLKLKYFNFSDFKSHGLLLCEYDSLGNIKREDEDFFFIDSIVVNKGNANIDTAKIILLISHRPKSNLDLKIESIDKNDRVLSSKSVNTKRNLVKFNFPIEENTNNLKITSVRYDSIKNKEKTFIIVNKILHD